jgi:hypothetical protein
LYVFTQYQDIHTIPVERATRVSDILFRTLKYIKLTHFILKHCSKIFKNNLF